MKDFAPLGQKFFDETEGAFTAKFDAEIFAATWARLIEGGWGFVLGAWIDGEPVGTIGATVAPDPCNGELVAQEAFWYVDPSKRGVGVRLFHEFVKLADTFASKITMGHLIASMPEKLAKLYMREGFKAVEIHYVRER